MKRGIFFILFLVIAGCTGRQIPANIIQPEEMKKVLWDITRAESLSGELSRRDSSINKIAAIKVLSDKIFSLHHISGSDFEKSYLWYTGHPDILKVMLDSMTAQNSRANRLELMRNTHPFKSDSAKRKVKLYE
ncbi:MAG TPA: DUF4296 domain-containing protein [Chitinophagaceae bacterium]|nr:DUF4296 domain-containing protein [Chitinophagaceae bacterium]